jgi:protein-S-isoprenylcysteine O-methyltransferase Ste14
MKSLITTVYGTAFSALCILNILLLTTVISKRFKLWPVPSRKSWQSYTFWPLFRGGLGLTFVYAALTVQAPGADDWPRLVAGGVLMAAGFGMAIYGYFDLGLENTYGSDSGLVTTGLYRYSRNPQYVMSILGFAGLALIHGQVNGIILCALAIVVYVILPFTEEPWLKNVYGQAYENYRAKTPRFL